MSRDPDAQLAAFEAYCRSDLLPWLQEAELTRRHLANQAYRRVAVVVIVCALIGIVGLRLNAALWIFLAFGLFGFGISMALKPLRAWGGRFKADLFAQVFGWFGYDYSSDVPDMLFEPLWASGILPAYDKRVLQDHVRGHVEAASFELADCHLIRVNRDSKGRRSESTVFQGLIGYYSIPKKFAGRTVLFTDNGIFNMLQGIGRAGERVHLEDPRFEEAFEVYSTDQIEARYLLTPAFMERVLAMRDRLGGRMQAAFTGGRFYLAVHLGRDQFPKPSIFSSVDNLDGINKLVSPIMFIASAVDILKLNQETHI
ncbi:MAG: DUF3137 domain-containing protein [Rhizobiales bacterium]|nr:DUF3137 domain-containing protein [Hyphomicrobiales bacterium]